MKKIVQPYVRMKHPEIANGFDLVLQTGGLQLVGAVSQFQHNTKGDEYKKHFLQSATNPYLWAKAAGYRVYIRLVGSLRNIDDAMTEDLREDIHRILQEMVQFYADYGMTDGQRRHFAEKEDTL